MSFSPPNYTDGVPVKISERFKPPPEIHLPSKLINALSRTQVPVAFHDYNFDLERKILSKTSEWVNWRANEKVARQQRIYERDQARQKKIENEQKEKLNQVSYPSADELTSSADEEEIDDEAKANIPFNTNFNSNTILMPTQVTSASSSNSNRKSHRRYASNSSNKIDFSFFESDASPFDHLEMKSLNEMEVLAQVLKSTAIESEDGNLERNNSSESENSETKGNNNNNNNNDQQPQPQDIQIPHAYNNFTPNATVYSNYYNYGNFSAHGTPTHNYQHQYASPFPPSYSSQQPTSNAYYAVNYVGGINNNSTNPPPQTTTTTMMACENNSSDNMEIRSVPDMVKELNEELDNSQKRRIRNYSQNSHKDDEEENVDDEVNVEAAKGEKLIKLIELK